LDPTVVDHGPERYELVTSPAVLDELSGGDPSRVAERLALVEHLPLLAIDPSVAEIVET
jgi:ABC-type thiamine transport system ATPase subunit